MRIGSGLSCAEDIVAALEEALDQALLAFEGESIDLAVLFLSSLRSASDMDEAAQILRQRLGQQTCLLGCTAQGVIGGGREVEAPPAVSLLLAALPEVKLTPFALRQPELEEFEKYPEDLLKVVEASPDLQQTFFVMSDPFSLDPSLLLSTFEAALPGSPLIGGLVSGGGGPGEHRLLIGDEVRDDGMVGLALSGNVSLRTVVSQGCRPVGRQAVITRGRGHLIETIAGRPALQLLQEVIDSLDEFERGLARRALHVGRVIDEQRDSFGRGDFLIRNIVGVDPRSGAIAASDTFRTGQTIQFHVRDRSAASEDLRELLKGMSDGEEGQVAPTGALAFTCSGRGSRFFGRPDHDSGALQEAFDELPVAGFFANGEIGPVGERAFLHGFTCSAVFFGPA